MLEATPVWGLRCLSLAHAVASPFVDMSEEELDAVDVDALASRVLRLGNELDQVSCRAAALL